MSTHGPRLQMTHSCTTIALPPCAGGLVSGAVFVVVVLTLLVLISHGYPWKP